MLVSFFKKHQFAVLLSLILILAVILRFPFLTKFPPAMLQDEVGIGYSAISIAQTGRDEWGNKFPLIFKSFGDYKAPLHIYTIALLYKLIGYKEALPRIASAIQGVFVVLLGALWIKKTFNSKHLGLMAGLILAISPWTVHISRLGFESNYGLMLFFAGLLFFSYAQESKFKLCLSALFFGLSSYSYHSYRYTILLFLATLITTTSILNFKNLKKVNSFNKTTLLVLLLTFIISLPGFLGKQTTGRLNQTLIFTSDNYIRLYQHFENNCHGTMIELNPKLTLLCKLKYNKYTRPVLIASDSYLRYLSPEFLFFSGDTEVSRNPTEAGEFYLILFPFWMIGVLLLSKNYKKKYFLIIGYLVAMLPSAMSGAPHAVRLTIMIPFALAVIITGYQQTLKLFKKFSWYPSLVVSLLFVSLFWFILNYTVDTFAAHEITATYLSYAPKVAKLEGQYVKKGYTVYADHDLYPEPHMYYAYFNQIDPKITQKSFAQVYQEEAGFSRPKQFGDKVFFKQVDFEAFDCNDPSVNPAVFFTNDVLDNIKPVKIIQDNTHLYNFVYVYESSQKCKQ